MHVAILYDGRSVCEWQRRAIAELPEDCRISWLIHEDVPQRQQRELRHAAYYALNLAAIRNRLTRQVPLAPPAGAQVLRFTPGADGRWAVLPEEVIDWLARQRVDAVIKFGLNLLRIPAAAPPVLSYHHGDPRSYRGRPAGFYEMRDGAPFMGQIVQILSNRLDAGEVLAFTETRVHRHSYRQTLLDAYTMSPRLLARALRALAAGERVAIAPTGPNFRLPETRAVAAMVGASMWELAKRLAYGAFVEKRWHVSRCSTSMPQEIATVAQAIEDSRPHWDTPDRLPGHTFYADGFFYGDGDEILVEALNKRSGKGEIVLLSGAKQQRLVSAPGCHISYPQSVVEDGVTYVVPETADWCPPTAFVVEGGALTAAKPLDIDADRLLDPTLLRVGDHIYLFGNDPADPAALHLWFADGLFARFQRHPASPIRVGARGSRMAGKILDHNGTLIRFGQDFRTGYGDGILAFRVDRLDPRGYRETEVAELSFGLVKGPHTLNRRGHSWLFDWYVERITPFAGLRRLLNRL